jgi:ketosteroid isomerase-like protein
MTDPLFEHMVARHEDFVRRFNAADADGIAATFYASDATMLPPGRAPIVGQEAIRTFLREFHAEGNRRCTIAVDRVESSGMLAYVIGSYWVEVRSASGAVNDQGSLLECWRCDEQGDWWCVADMYVSTAIRDANEAK